MESLVQQFNSISKQYDQQRQYLIPCFNDFYTAAMPLVARVKEAKRVLDIGAGTGLFSYFLYQQYPQLEYILVDVSADMLQVARKRFEGLEQFHFLEMDFGVEELPSGNDIVISALAIHHLEDAAKQDLYRRVYDSLNAGGLFINADQVSGRTAGFDAYYKEEWRKTISASPLGEEAVARALERVKLDRFASLEEQLRMLEGVGFGDVDCVYKSGNFVVFAGFKGD